MARVTIRYWAGAREAAGVDVETFEAATVEDAIALAEHGRGGDAEFARVLGLCSFLLDGRRVGPADRTRPLTDDVELEALPPFAGG
ncbi:MoaD/ThiS family protein [Raineyella sp.]|uniref:Molybdopterin synthase sulfur carrier subunit n=1 Tax=bioreactor metagenome TaxID=1076179 RepID=A0A644YZU5_9ZZZZ|nr:MoaD/ThiS family protein [Raineyella sp.]MEA5155162.1 MoaD/ThiS family protein [Raineyella sp.]